MRKSPLTYDRLIRSGEALRDRQFHLSCGFCSTTAFFFAETNIAVVIDCGGTFTFYTAEGEKVIITKAKPMDRGCYMDVLITTIHRGVVFRLPQYDRTDHAPHCHGESTGGAPGSAASGTRSVMMPKK